MFYRCFSFALLLSASWLAGDISFDDAVAVDRRSWFLAAAEPEESAMPVYPAPISKDKALDTVDSLKAKAGDISEPSIHSETRYVDAIRAWLATLEPFKRERAREIMLEAHPELSALREAIRDKKSELASISFGKGMPPETLPRLGMELQKLRANLSAELKRVSERLRYEAGVDMAPPGDSFWLSPSPDK